MQTGGVREQLSSPSLPFCGRVPPSPSLPLMPRRGTSFSPWMRKGGKRIIWGVHARRNHPGRDCISTAVRVAFLTRRSGIEKQPVPRVAIIFPLRQLTREKSPLIDASYLAAWEWTLSTQAAYAGRKGSALMPLPRGLEAHTMRRLVRECRSRRRQGPGTNPSGAGKR